MFKLITTEVICVCELTITVPGTTGVLVSGVGVAGELSVLRGHMEQWRKLCLAPWFGDVSWSSHCILSAHSCRPCTYVSCRKQLQSILGSSLLLPWEAQDSPRRGEGWESRGCCGVFLKQALKAEKQLRSLETEEQKRILKFVSPFLGSFAFLSLHFLPPSSFF